MSENTQKLKLQLPPAGSINWGGAVNSNFRKIDNEFIDILSNFAALRAELGALNYISINPEKNGWFFHVSDEVYIGKIKNDAINADENITYETLLEDGKKYSSASLGELEEYSGYIVVNSWDADKESGSPWNIDWFPGDIIVKFSAVENNQRKTKFAKFPQSLGGFYKPTFTINSSNGEWTLNWDKYITANTQTQYQYEGHFPLPYCETGLFHGLVEYTNTQWKKDGDNRYYILPENIQSKGYEITSIPTVGSPIVKDLEQVIPPSIDCMFWYKDDGIWQRIELDYCLSFVDNRWRLILRPDASLDYTNLTVMIKYYTHLTKTPEQAFYQVTNDA